MIIVRHSKNRPINIYFNYMLYKYKDQNKMSSHTSTIMQQLLEAAAKQPRTYLLSYPRSGNTWIRYCIEVIAQRPTAHMRFSDRPIGMPLALLTGHALDYDRPPVWKAHSEQELGFKDHRYNARQDWLICVLRNPKEAIKRQAGTAQLMSLAQDSDSAETRRSRNAYGQARSYFDVLKIYDQWDQNKRHLVYYEDLMRQPQQELERLWRTLGDQNACQQLPAFMQEFARHREAALNIYKYQGGSHTNGVDLLQHSRDMPLADRRRLDQAIAQQYPDLWSKYLQQRYAEQENDQSNTTTTQKSQSLVTRIQ